MKRHLLGIILFIGVFVAALAGTAIAVYGFVRTAPNSSGETVDVSIGDHTKFTAVSQALQQKGVISSAKLFDLYLLTTRSYKNIQPGVYQLSPKMTPRIVRQYLVEGRISAYRVTFIEGWAVRDMASELEKKGIVSAADFKNAAQDQEGYLFPDTYQFKKDVTAKEVVKKMRENFDLRTAALHPTRDQIVIASIVEREAKFDVDRPKIAGVYQKRYDQEMKLEADPTVQYAKGSWGPITTADYQNVKSPYNTYLNVGLPPGPICNPGLKSLEAAVHPEITENLYFFHLKDGTTIYSKTQTEHDQNKKKYKNQR